MPRKRSSEEVQEILERFQASGLSQMEYCRQSGIILSSLGRYLRQARSPEQQLVRIKIESPPDAATGFVLMLGNGRRIASDWGFAEAELARLIRVAESA
ncbi:MAG TPA: hypothetical protein VLJ11_03035 [Bryobacteraceae bacterium]|nr:hypothetical protein [Bryobacteraceae bacterium]